MPPRHSERSEESPGLHSKGSGTAVHPTLASLWMTEGRPSISEIVDVDSNCYLEEAERTLRLCAGSWLIVLGLPPGARRSPGSTAHRGTRADWGETSSWSPRARVTRHADRKPYLRSWMRSAASSFDRGVLVDSIRGGTTAPSSLLAMGKIYRSLAEIDTPLRPQR